MQILFRKTITEEEEFNVAHKYFDVVEHRTDCHDKIIIGRYSVLPYYKELEKDLNNYDCYLINTYKQHHWIANFDWYSLLSQYTPKTYFSEEEVIKNYSGPLVIKGRTNSRKHQWNTHMFANNISEMYNVAKNLRNDSLLCYQPLIFREYVPLEIFERGINELPFSNEWRFFFYKHTLIDYGYYWSIAEQIPTHIDSGGIDFAQMVANKVAKYVDFFVIDIAKTANGNWIVIELNDGQMSGLSTINYDNFYSSLHNKLLSYL